MAESDRAFKGAIYEQIARVGKAFSSATRLELLDLLCQGERTVEKLAGEIGTTVANVSQHLRALRAARLVEARKDGQFVTYRIIDADVAAFVRAIRLFAERHLLEIRDIERRFLAGRDGMDGVDRTTLLAQVREGAVTVLDVRPPEEYAAGHIPGAISVPLRELEQRLADIPKNHRIVAYCRGPYCVLAVKAVERLRAHGFDAVRLEDGVADWEARGLPVDREGVIR